MTHSEIREVAKRTYRHAHLLSTGMHPENTNTSETNHECAMNVIAHAIQTEVDKEHARIIQQIKQFFEDNQLIACNRTDIINALNGEIGHDE